MNLTDEALEQLRPKSPLWSRLPMRDWPYDEVINLGAYQRNERDNPLRAIVTIDLYSVGAPLAGDWLHLSVSRAKRMPTWGDLTKTRSELGYDHLSFVQLLPPKSHWINVMPFCLHLWARLDGDTVPRCLWDQVGSGTDIERKAAP